MSPTLTQTRWPIVVAFFFGAVFVVLRDCLLFDGGDAFSTKVYSTSVYLMIYSWAGAILAYRSSLKLWFWLPLIFFAVSFWISIQIPRMPEAEFPLGSFQSVSLTYLTVVMATSCVGSALLLRILEFWIAKPIAYWMVVKKRWAMLTILACISFGFLYMLFDNQVLETFGCQSQFEVSVLLGGTIAFTVATLWLGHLVESRFSRLMMLGLALAGLLVAKAASRWTTQLLTIEWLTPVFCVSSLIVSQSLVWRGKIRGPEDFPKTTIWQKFGATLQLALITSLCLTVVLNSMFVYSPGTSLKEMMAMRFWSRAGSLTIHNKSCRMVMKENEFVTDAQCRNAWALNRVEIVGGKMTTYQLQLLIDNCPEVVLDNVALEESEQRIERFDHPINLRLHRLTPQSIQRLVTEFNRTQFQYSNISISDSTLTDENFQTICDAPKNGLFIGFWQPPNKFDRLPTNKIESHLDYEIYLPICPGQQQENIEQLPLVVAKPNIGMRIVDDGQMTSVDADNHRFIYDALWSAKNSSMFDETGSIPSFWYVGDLRKLMNRTEIEQYYLDFSPAGKAGECLFVPTVEWLGRIDPSEFPNLRILIIGPEFLNYFSTSRKPPRQWPSSWKTVKLTQLESLYLSRDLTFDDYSFLQSMPSLKYLRFEYFGPMAAGDALTEIQKLTHIERVTFVEGIWVSIPPLSDYNWSGVDLEWLAPIGSSPMRNINSREFQPTEFDPTGSFPAEFVEHRKRVRDEILKRYEAANSR